jgi:hypothetical protein
MELRTFEQVKAAGQLVAHMTRERIMPPFLADNSGDCATYEDANWLTDAEIETISRWVKTGMKEGDASASPVFEVNEDHIAEPSVLLTPPEAYTPNSIRDDDDYRCFVIDPELATDKYITEYEVITAHPELVHHVIVYNPTSEQAEAYARDLDAAEDGLGYTCFGGPLTEATVAAAWAPGRYRWKYPEGTGVPLRAGRAQIVQVHYHVHGDAVADQSSVALKLVDSVDQELLPWFYANTDLSLPPGRDVATARFETSPNIYMNGAGTPHYAEPMTVVGIGAHMHKLGVSERVELTKADGSATSCLIDVKRWDFDWQYAYFLENPVRLDPNDLLRMTCKFNTSGETKTTRWGEGTDEEMCLALMYSVFDGGKIPTPSAE